MPTPTANTTTHPASLTSSPLPPSDSNAATPSPPSFATFHSASPACPLPTLLNHHLHALHAYLATFQYNTTLGPEHTPNIQAIKTQPLRTITHTAQHIIQRRQPIRCLEAVVVALHLLAAAEAEVAERCAGVRLLRYPLRFYTTCGGHRYWHILLVVALMPLTPPSSVAANTSSVVSLPVFGAVSLSRHAPLSFRELSFESLSSLCSSLREEYARIGHSLIQMTVGLPTTNNDRSKHSLDWHFLALQLPASNKQHSNTNTPTPTTTTPTTITTSPPPNHHHPHSPAPSDPTQPDSDDGACEITIGSPACVAVVDDGAVVREWRCVCDVLDRYALRASDYAAQMAFNRQRPALARPLTALHPHCHYDQRTQQLKYDGTVPKRRESVRATSTKATKTEAAQRETSRAVGARVEKGGSVSSSRVAPSPLPRRHTLPAQRTADRSAFAV